MTTKRPLFKKSRSPFATDKEKWEAFVVASYLDRPRMPSDQAIHEQTIKYLREDFNQNHKKYAPADRVRIAEKLGLNCT
jgi:hypothetical protein